MIHHVSIAAREPQRVAEVLAELMNGKCFPFGPLEGAFMAVSGDERHAGRGLSGTHDARHTGHTGHAGRGSRRR